MQIEKLHIHEHPLTLSGNRVDEIDGGETYCPVCREELHYGHHCSNCKFHPGKCFACDGETSGRFYFCRQCLPNSPLFHLDCCGLPRQIRVAWRPHCSINLVKKECRVSSDMSFLRDRAFHCDYCGKSQRGFTFRCDLCNFVVCTGCVHKLIKYDDSCGRGEREHIQLFSHQQHPLILMGEMAQEQCKICCQIIDGGDRSCYCCAPCGVYVHRSCGELSQQVRYPFHPRHSLTLEGNKSSTGSGRHRYCDVCCFYIDPDSMSYRCDSCHFDLHPECMLLKPNIKYQGHRQHLLVLVENVLFEGQCQACRSQIKGTFFLRCIECLLNFHVHCSGGSGSVVVASLPPVVVAANHSHPLSIITVEDDDSILPCSLCEEERYPDHPSYACVQCGYYVHVRCAITEIQLSERERRHKHISHIHPLVLLENESSHDTECYACKKLIARGYPSYGCEPCRVRIHKSCFELPFFILHKSHSHYLTLHKLLYSRGVCKSCGKDLHGLIYHCETCSFDLDLDCATQHPSMKWGANSFDEVDQDVDIRIGHFSHYHPLTRSYHEVGDNAECKLCSKNIHGWSFGCTSCMFYIHKACAELTQEVQHSFHPRHCLTLRGNASSKGCDDKGFVCGACCFNVDPSIYYRCDDCKFNLHFGCATLKPDIKYLGHQHHVILVENMTYQSQCGACRCNIDGTFFLRCVECDINFHVHCGPTSLPPTIEYQQHSHPLSLTIETILKDGDDLICCMVCGVEETQSIPITLALNVSTVHTSVA